MSNLRLEYVILLTLFFFCYFQSNHKHHFMQNTINVQEAPGIQQLDHWQHVAVTNICYQHYNINTSLQYSFRISRTSDHNYDFKNTRVVSHIS